MADQYLNPGADFIDETEDEGQHIIPAQSFIDSPAQATAPTLAQPVVFVVT